MKKVSICCSLRPLREKVAEGRMRGAVTGQPLPSKQGAVVGQALPDNAPQGHLPGFTLIELLVVVMIIAILAAIAVPQYKRAVLKSRFSTVMPMAKSIANAQEVYYQGRQMYALDVDELDVTPVNAENTSVTLSQTDGYDYVMAQNSQVPGANYIIYQKYSENYPSEIHCEAEKDNADANWLCSALSNNNKVGVTLTQGYDTYLIKGSGMGISPWSNAPTCDAAEEMGYTCSITTNQAGEQVKKVCSSVGNTNFCRTKTYDEDGSYTSVTCQADGNGVCTSNLYTATYNEDGNKTSVWYCRTVASDGTCSSVYNSGTHYTYDANGNMTSQRGCSWVATSDGTCNGYDSGAANYDYTYDANGNKTSQRRCRTVASDGTCNEYTPLGGENYDYTYDANGNMLTERRCSSVDSSSGNCTSYYNYGNYDYTYDANGNQVTQRTCSSVDSSSGNCTAYATTFGYIYDANGNQLMQRECSSVDSNGNCTAYSSGNSNFDYTYDANGNRLTQRWCSFVDSSGNCTRYYNGRNYNYTYDANGNQLTWRICSSVDSSSGNCTAYSNEAYDYTYDANGNQTSRRDCSTVAIDGTCSAYRYRYNYTYDDNGKRIAEQYCSGSNLNTATGECLAYNSTSVSAN